MKALLERVEAMALRIGHSGAKFPSGALREVLRELHLDRYDDAAQMARSELGTRTRIHNVLQHVHHVAAHGLSGQREALRDALLRLAAECVAWARDEDEALGPAPSPSLAKFKSFLEKKVKR